MEHVFPYRLIAATLVLFGCASVLAAHLAALYTSGLDPVSTPIGALSQSVDGNLNSLGMLLFAMAQVALAALLNRSGARFMTRIAQLLLVVDAALIAHLAWRFATTAGAAPRGPVTDDCLWLIASCTALVMAFALSGLLRWHHRAGVWNLALLLVWFVLAPLVFVVDSRWIGAYERLAGAVLIAWEGGLAMLIGFDGERSTPDRRSPRVADESPRHSG